jgi:hypothetical protein
MEKRIRNVTIIGGGNSAHVIIPLLAKQGYHITLLTRKPKKWKSTIVLDHNDSEGHLIKRIKGNIDKISDNYQEVISKTDLVLLCLPVHIYPEIIDLIGSCVKGDKKIIIGTIYGQGGFNWMVEKTIKKYNLTNVGYFAYGLIPFICRIKEYGQSAITYGSKQKNLVATSSQELYDELAESFLDDCCFNFFNEGKFYKVPNFISLTLSVDNQIIHPCRLFDLYKLYKGHWNTLEEVPYFYRDFTHTAANTMKAIDTDLDKIRNAVKDKYKDTDYSLMLNYMDLEKFSYSFPIDTVYSSFIDSETLNNIKTPVIKTADGYDISKKSRFFTDDIFYGLCIFKSIAQYLDVATLNLDELLRWAEKTTGILILTKENKLNTNLASGSIFKYEFEKEDMLTK